jgi:sec-independent protein translocase protein TatA
MFDSLGWPEIILILGIVILVFGAGKLPQVGKDVGRAIREFRKAQKGEDEEQKPAAALKVAGKADGTDAEKSKA